MKRMVLCCLLLFCRMPDAPDPEIIEVEPYHIAYYPIVWTQDWHHGKGFVVIEAGIVRNLDDQPLVIVPLLMLFRDERHEFLIGEYAGYIFDSLEQNPLTGELIFGNLLEYLPSNTDARCFVESEPIAKEIGDVYPLMRFYVTGHLGKAVIEFALPVYKRR